jgi:hypothetical protein
MLPRTVAGFDLFEDGLDLRFGPSRVVRAFREEGGHHLIAGFADRILAFHLGRDLVGLSQIIADHAIDGIIELREIFRLEVARFLGAFSASWMIASITGWKPCDRT